MWERKDDSQTQRSSLSTRTLLSRPSSSLPKTSQSSNLQTFKEYNKNIESKLLKREGESADTKTSQEHKKSYNFFDKKLKQIDTVEKLQQRAGSYTSTKTKVHKREKEKEERGKKRREKISNSSPQS